MAEKLPILIPVPDTEQILNKYLLEIQLKSEDSSQTIEQRISELKDTWRIKSKIWN